MKKAITILAVLIVLVGAVFADETHTLKIKAYQVTIPPAFQMYVKSVSQTGATNDDTIITNSNATVYDVRDDATDEKYNESATEAATFSFETANTVTIAVKLGNAAKTAANYKLTFLDGTFNVSKNGADEYDTGKKDDQERPIMASYKVTATRTAAAGANDGAANGFVAAPSNNTVTIDFNGKTCISGHEVATCNYAYAAHTDVDPGTYYANVVLTIETAN